jgi:hypothetical protein
MTGANLREHIQHWLLFFAVMLCIAKFFLIVQFERFRPQTRCAPARKPE